MNGLLPGIQPIICILIVNSFRGINAGYIYPHFLVKPQLYRILKKRLSSVKADEVAILFCPYPVVNDYQHAVFMQFATDFLQAVVNELEEEISACRGAYFLYPSMEKGILVLRDASTRAREYIDAPEIAEYISFDTVPIVE